MSVIRGWQDENDREACIESRYIKKSAFRRDLCGDSAYNGIVYDNREHFGEYFRHYDHDYNDLKRLLGVEPLMVTILPVGSLKKYENRFGKKIRRINPSAQDVIVLRYLLNEPIWQGGARL